MSEHSDFLRRTFKEGDDKRDAGLTTPPDIVRFDDLAYGADRKWQVLDVYRPRAAGEAPLPVIVSVHGGGWVYGDKERYQYYGMLLAQQGFAVVNYTYRLAPEFQFPAPLEDLVLVLDWCRANAARYGLDLDNAFAVGDSAGAQILGSFAAAVAVPRRKAPYPVPEAMPFRALGLNCGVYEVTIDDPGTAQLMRDYLPRGGSKRELALMSVASRVTKAFPPCFVMTAYADHAKPHAPALVRALEANGVEFVYRVYGSRANPLRHDFHCNVRLPDAALCAREECAFFRTFVR